VRLEGLGQLKNPMISSGIETATFRLVAKTRYNCSCSDCKGDIHVGIVEEMRAIFLKPRDLETKTNSIYKSYTGNRVKSAVVYREFYTKIGVPQSE
jgi:hypothetical protein